MMHNDKVSAQGITKFPNFLLCFACPRRIMRDKLDYCGARRLGHYCHH